MGSENNLFDEFFFLNILFKDNIYLLIKCMIVCIFVYELNIERYVYILNMYLKKVV